MQRLDKLSLLIPFVIRHGSYLIIEILTIPPLPLEWKLQELLRYLVHQKRSMVTSFNGYGDSKAYSAVKDIYSPTKPIKKCECVSHYQKRVSLRFCNLKTKQNKQTTKKKKHTHTHTHTKGLGEKENSLILKLTQYKMSD